ncbi:ribonuclease P protein component [Candidatus Azambacteria bacterium]|nr:ribonuclease P protein component [Candidatus Azambacteria bacterium]MBI3685336.1 ribonuclease P protein component [Candidatus Azambacteria bacterium]
MITQSEFRHILAKGRFISTPLFLLKYVKGREGKSRAGFVVSKKVSKNAVERNKVKRIMREIVGKEINFLKKGYDTVFIAKKQIASLAFKKVKEKILESLARI